jgi:hypothetical protein
MGHETHRGAAIVRLVGECVVNENGAKDREADAIEGPSVTGPPPLGAALTSDWVFAKKV